MISLEKRKLRFSLNILINVTWKKIDLVYVAIKYLIEVTLIVSALTTKGKKQNKTKGIGGNF